MEIVEVEVEIVPNRFQNRLGKRLLSKSLNIRVTRKRPGL